MCDAAGCDKTTPGGGLCRQCQTEAKWEGSASAATSSSTSAPACWNCGSEVRRKKYHPHRPGVVLCEDCWKETNRENDLVTDGGAIDDAPPDRDVDSNPRVVAVVEDNQLVLTSPGERDEWIVCEHARDLEASR